VAKEPGQYGGRGAEDYKQAEWLAHYLKGEWRFDHTTEKWHHFDGVRWAKDDTQAIHKAIADLAGERLKKAKGELELKLLFAMLQWPTQERVLKALSTFEGYGTNGDDWDSDPYLLGCKNGVVDLRKNTLVPATPEQKVTQSTGVKFVPLDDPDQFRDPVVGAPLFMGFMDDITSGDPAMVAFLLLWYGASLFGFTPEQRFLLMTGIGRNGKGTLKHSVMKAVGEYGAQYDANLYMRSRFGAARADQARADLIALKGKRITFFSEPEGGRFNEEMLKAHTGGDTITARALHSNNVQTWEPTHSITFLVNNAPEVEDLGPSMGARVMVADFRERYDGEQEDKQLYGKLEAEAVGILGILCWAAKAWYQSWSTGQGGITLPARVIEQSQQFMERGDAVANWLNERGEYGPKATQNSQLAYESYLNWFTRSGEEGEPMSMVRWALALQKKGFKKEKTRTGAVWTGFRILGAMELADKGIDEDEAP
jgi:putative DNA primase/helicase